MIIATIKTTSTFVDRPKVTEISIDENTIAGEKPNGMGKLEKITIGQLYDLYAKGNQYIKDASDPEDHLTPDLFEKWFYKHYIHEKGLMQRVISIEFKKEA
jgi:hypothetical protein